MLFRSVDVQKRRAASTIGEMDELQGTQSASAPAEFMLLHEAIEELDADALPPPRHAFELRIALGANTWEFVNRAIDDIRRDLDRNREHTGCASGSPDGCYSIDIQRRDITPAAYREELREWSDADRARRHGC